MNGPMGYFPPPYGPPPHGYGMGMGGYPMPPVPPPYAGGGGRVGGRGGRGGRDGRGGRGGGFAGAADMGGPAGPGPRGAGVMPRARPFQNRTWVNPNAAAASADEEGETTENGGSDVTIGGSNAAPAPTATGAGASFVPRNPYHATQMRPRFQNKTWVRPDANPVANSATEPTKDMDDALSMSLPTTPPQAPSE
jgi:hypothetical protein